MYGPQMPAGYPQTSYPQAAQPSMNMVSPCQGFILVKMLHVYNHV